MAERPSPVPADPATAAALGEVRGQLRELIHTINNFGQRSEANSRILLKLEDMPARLEKIDERMTLLEAKEYRREGANGLLATFLKSPALGWLAGVALAVWAFLSGKDVA